MSDAVFKKVSILTNRALMLLANCCVLIICWSSMTAAVCVNWEKCMKASINSGIKAVQAKARVR